MTKTPKAQKNADAQQTEAERDLDEALEELFPASDPPSVTRTSAGAPDHGAAKQSRQRAGGYPKRK